MIRGCVFFFLSASAYADWENPFIQHWHNGSEYVLTVKGGTPWHGQNLAPAIGTEIGSNVENEWVLFNDLLVDIPNVNEELSGVPMPACVPDPR